MAKQRTKNNWYKGKIESEPPTSPYEEMEAARFSIHQEDPSTPQEDKPSQQEEPSIQQEGQSQTGEVVSKEQIGDVQVSTPREGEQEQVQKAGKED